MANLTVRQRRGLVAVLNQTKVKLVEKHWYESRTIWISVAGVLGALTGYMSGELSLDAAITASVLALLNGANRFSTVMPLK